MVGDRDVGRKCLRQGCLRQGETLGQLLKHIFRTILKCRVLQDVSRSLKTLTLAVH